jgi:hypothetical protein
MGLSGDGEGVRRERLACALADLEAVLETLGDDPHARAAVAAAIAFIEGALDRSWPAFRVVPPRDTPEQ